LLLLLVEQFFVLVVEQPEQSFVLDVEHPEQSFVDVPEQLSTLLVLVFFLPNITIPPIFSRSSLVIVW